MKLIFLTALILLLILSIRFIQFFSGYHFPQEGDRFEKEFIILSTPIEGNFYQTIRVDSILIQIPKYPRYKIADKIYIEGKIEKSGKFLIVKNPKIEKLEHNNLVIKSAAFLKEKISSTFTRYLPRDESALLLGVLLGGSQGFSREQSDAFEKTGVLHVVAASGMNVTMVASLLFLVSSSFLSRRKAILLSILGIFYYALLAGMGASVLRAAVMGSIVFTAAILGRKNLAFVSLFLTGFLMLTIHPLTIFDISFQLSFLSTLGILSVKPVLDSIKLFKKIPLVSDDLSTTISAQAGSLPILAKTFSFYSLTSVLVNGLVLWTIPILMVLGGLAAICSIVLPLLSVIFLYLAYPLLLYFEKVVMVFSKVPGLDFSDSNWMIWIGYYLVIFSILIKIKIKNED